MSVAVTLVLAGIAGVILLHWHGVVAEDQRLEREALDGWARRLVAREASRDYRDDDWWEDHQDALGDAYGDDAA